MDGFYHNPFDDNKLGKALKLSIKNIETGKSSTKKCYQDENEILANVAHDLRDGKKVDLRVFGII